MLQLEASQESLLVTTIPAEVMLFTSTMPVKLTLSLNSALYSYSPPDREKHLYMWIFLRSLTTLWLRTQQIQASTW